ncbi:hypothetical protein [Azospirillum griseum]|uniref:Phage tail assembly chaperone n=1 Tax=Azospirillum griseum TaxID=2496639 RepID=A0A3S0K8A0_9PROT|nr:hypothetical protein [Azospirillum griseum]RTR16157.1 hypothetical protein EJ903_21420 [Azospirillum griseum]
MKIIETVQVFDSATHRQAATFTETKHDDFILRVWDVELIPPDDLAVEAAAKRRSERDTAMAEPLAILSRHQNQRDFDIPTTLTDEQAMKWALYLQGLRDYPETGVWPKKPE